MKYKIIWSLIFSLITSRCCIAQDMFQKYISNYSTAYPLIGNGAFQTNDHGFIVMSAQTYTMSNDQDVSIIKTDSSGQALWGKLYSGQYQTGVSMIRQTPDSGFVFTGESNGFGTNWEQVYLIRTDKNGDTLWTRFYNDFNNYESKDLCLSSDSGFVVIGNEIFSDVFVLKTDQIGNTVFNFQYGISGYTMTGYSLRETNDGGFIIAGDIKKNIGGVMDVFLLKLNSIGQVDWCRKYDGTGEDHAYTIQQTIDGGFIVSGMTQSFGAGSNDVLLMKTNSIGDIDWVRSYGGQGPDQANYIQQTRDSGFVISGTTYSFPINLTNSYLIKTDPIGNMTFSRTLGGVRVMTVDEIYDGGYLLGGVAGSLPQCYLIKTDSLGNTGCTNNIPVTVETVGTFVDSNLTVTKFTVGLESRYSFNVSTISQIESECLINSINNLTSLNSNLISFSPNPLTESSSTITFSENISNAEVIISDLLGKVVMKKSVNGKALDIESAHLKNGLYLMNVNGKGISFQAKLIVL